jgi:hypothetical protein
VRLAHHAFDVSRDGDVGGDSRRAHTGCRNLTLGLAQRLFAARNKRDVAALGRQR